MSHLHGSKHLFLTDFVIFLLLGPAFSPCHGRLFKDKNTNEMLNPFTETCMEPTEPLQRMGEKIVDQLTCP